MMAVAEWRKPLAGASHFGSKGLINTANLCGSNPLSPNFEKPGELQKYGSNSLTPRQKLLIEDYHECMVLYRSVRVRIAANLWLQCSPTAC